MSLRVTVSGFVKRLVTRETSNHTLPRGLIAAGEAFYRRDDKNIRSNEAVLSTTATESLICVKFLSLAIGVRRLCWGRSTNFRTETVETNYLAAENVTRGTAPILFPWGASQKP